MTGEPTAKYGPRREKARHRRGRASIAGAPKVTKEQSQLAEISDLVGRPIEIGVDTEFATRVLIRLSRGRTTEGLFR